MISNTPHAPALLTHQAQVCWRSAKVQLNNGILERRLKNWDRALEHFEAAREIEPGYCEPSYWIGMTLVEANKDVEAGLKVMPTQVSGFRVNRLAQRCQKQSDATCS